LAISWILENELPSVIDIGTSVGATNLELLETLEDLLHSKNQLMASQNHEIGVSEVFVAGKGSPLFASGWMPKDTIRSGLEWTLER
jgi:nucleoside-diphosphate-sugar epimerase